MTISTKLPNTNSRKSLFDKYDPFNQEIPSFADHEVRWTIDYVVTRTREALIGRSKDELIKTHWFLRNLMRDAEHKLTMAATKRAQQPGGPKSEYLTQPKAILELFSSYDLEDDGPLANGTAEDYFNVLALMEAYDAIAAFYRAEELSNKANLDALEKNILAGCDRSISASAIEGSELISFIDGMMFRRQEQGKTNRQAASQRHKDTKRIKANYVSWYKQNHLKTKSKNQAAIQFHSQLPYEDQRKIQPEALVRHLRTELRKTPNMLLEDA